MGSGFLETILNELRDIDSLRDVFWLATFVLGLPFTWVRQVGYAFGPIDGLDWWVVFFTEFVLP